jgi:hypothetical protein
MPDRSSLIRQARYLTQRELSERWKISERTLEGWRFRGDCGPAFHRIGRAVRYELKAIEAFEAEQLVTIARHRR